MEIPKELREFGLVEPGSSGRSRYLVSTSEGEPGTGKSGFFYRTFPGPKLTVDVDLNGEGPEEQYSEKDDTLIYRYPLSPDIDQDRDFEKFQELKEMFERSVRKKLFRSIMFDTFDAVYEWCRRAYHGTLEFGEIPESKFRVVNSNMARFLTLAKQHRVNLYLPHRLKDERRDVVNKRSGKVGSARTGKRIAAGWKSALYDSQCHIVFGKDEEETSIDKFTATIRKCTGNTLVEGRVFVGEEIDLALIGKAIYPASKIKEWR